MKSFWNNLPKAFFALAPMADVTDPAYRRLVAETTKPDIMWTEFVSADGLYHTREKKKMPDAENPLFRDIAFMEAERPIVAQFFTSNPDMMEYAAALAVELGFDGVDINMGCPVGPVQKQGAGACLIKDPLNAKNIITAAIRGVQGKIPVSVKTRIGYNQVEYEEWLPHLLETDIAGLTLHLRTRKEMSAVPAHYELASEIVAFVKDRRPDIPLLANGDLRDLADAHDKIVSYGFDGAMLGRAIFGNPWLFSGRAIEEITPKEKLEALLQLARYFDELRPKKHFAILKKHFKAFVSGWPDAAGLRTKLMETKDLKELESAIAGAAL